MDKKNTLLLTVIAVATLLVAIVGATFAYFTAQIGSGAEANIDVKTKTSDVLSYGTFGSINIVANQENFAKSKGSQKGTTTGELSLKVNNDSEAEYCYTVTLDVKTNTFSHYPDGQEDPKAGIRKVKPELLFAIYNDVTDDGSGSKEEPSYKEITDTITGFGLSGVHQEISDQGGDDDLTNLNVCDNSNGSVSEPCSQVESINGYDITTVGNSSGAQIKIPNKSYSSDGLTDEYQFKIAGAKEKTITHYWKAEVVFLNWNWDQQYNASITSEQATELNKMHPDAGYTEKTVAFNAQLKFANVPCSNAE